MSAQASLARPGVEVIQVFRTVSPTVQTPTLVPSIVGACKQIVDAVVTSAAGGSQVNAQAKVQLPAFFTAAAGTGSPPAYAGLTGTLQFSVNNHPTVNVTFVTGTYKPSDVVFQVKKALALYGETAVVPEIVGTSPLTGDTWRLRTLGSDEFQVIKINPDGTSAAQSVGTTDITPGGLYGIGGTLDGLTLIITHNAGAPVTLTLNGATNTANQAALLAAILVAFPWLATAVAGGPGGNKLVLTTTVMGYDEYFTFGAGTANTALGLTTGSISRGKGSKVSLLAAFGLNPRDLFVGASGYAGYELDIPTTNFPDPRGNLDELSFETDTERAFVTASGGASLLELKRTQCVLRKGGALTVIDSGDGTNQSPYVEMAGEDFTSVATVPTQGSIAATGIPVFASLNGKTLIVGYGKFARTVQFDAPATITDVVNQINAVFDVTDGLEADEFPVLSGKLRLTCTKKREDGTTTALGEDSQVVIYGGTAMTPANLLDNAPGATLKMGRYAGSPQRVDVGDLLYVDGVYVGTVTQVAPGGLNARLKLDRRLTLTFTGTNFYIEAQNLVPLPAGSPLRPAPDLVVDGYGNLKLKLGFIRDTKGDVVESVTTTALIPGRGSMYVSYKALRLDVTQKAKAPGLLRLNDTIQLEQLLSPVSPENPLALGLFFALINGPAIQATGLGVDEVSANEPFGTLQSFARATTYLEGFEVYAIAPLTHETEVGQVFKAHVDSMSLPENKGERIVLFNPSRPTHKLDTLVASGSDGNTVGVTGLQFDTGIGNLAALLLAAGIDPTAAIPVDAGLFLNIAANNYHYNISAISGSVVTVNVTFLPGENDDGFYTTTDLNDPPLPAALIEEPFALRIRGAALVLGDGSPDKDGMASTYSALASSYADRRYWQTMPDTCSALVQGIEQVIDGFYMNAAIAGMIGQQPPQQSFTNFPMTGFTQVIGSQDFFNERQLNNIAGGGNYIIVQDVAGGPLISRMALTTDLTSVESRTDSITKIVDFCAKFLHKGLKNFIGRFNITQGFLDTLGHVLEGLLGFLKESGILIGAHVNNLIQDTSAPDTVLIDITLDVPYPCNYIRLTLVI